VPVNLVDGDQQSDAYRAVNPQGLIPALETDNGGVLAQSVAIMEWLEEVYPEPALLPADAWERARVRSLVGTIACDIHPILNLSILNYLKGPLQAEPAQVKAWYRTWIRRGFESLELALKDHGGAFCCGDAPTLADCCLVPQVFNARRFEVPLEDFPTVCRLSDHCSALEPFAAAHPGRQPDARA
jgi:maleylacetoacetate isomerase